MTKLELLSPAKNADIGIAAINHGADAVYIGARSHGARQGAVNSTAEIARLCEYAHKFYAKVYVTLNTLVYEEELKSVEKLIDELYRIQVDALIIQDLGILRMDIPPIALHASTQCDIRNAETAKLYEGLGFSQIVLAREMSLTDIRSVREAVDVPLEAFVHGALCVCYSGCCTAGQRLMGRSGNRGECPQVCRLPFSLTDSKGRKIVENRHLLSLKDMNRLNSLEEMAEAGISSFKIEGRLKGAPYVKNVVSAYRREIDRIIEKSDGKFSRSSEGQSVGTFIPDLSKSFNRGYTEYFLHGKEGSGKMGSHLTPKMTGEKIGRVKSVRHNFFTADLEPGTELNNGDGIGYFTKAGDFHGFRLNKSSEGRYFPLNPEVLELKPGTTLYRNFDKSWNDKVEGDKTERKLEVDIRLRQSSDNKRIFLDLSDGYGHSVTVSAECGNLEKAKSAQESYRSGIFGKLGDTLWQLRDYKDDIGGLFLPASLLTSLRRNGIEMLERCRRICRKTDMRRKENPEKVKDALRDIESIRNISNHLAENFLADYGTVRAIKALEVSSEASGLPVMECRYCLKRELGECPKENKKGEIQATRGPLYLDTGKVTRYRVEFDCKNCRMLLFEP